VSPQNEPRARALGINAFLQKPVDNDTLLEHVQAALSG
jgi:hypothetical protein